MYMFINNAGIVAYTILMTVRGEITSTYDGAANICNAGIANADPIIVCGRLNLHNTENTLEVNEDDDEDDTASSSSSSGIVTAVVLDNGVSNRDVLDAVV
jgi:hypothetical protein